jgi:predicted DNA-binding transcriptional regulator AlpA
MHATKGPLERNPALWRAYIFVFCQQEKITLHLNLETTLTSGIISDLAAAAEKLLNDNEAAEQLGVSPATLRSWRCRGIGPAFLKLGNGIKSAVRYSVSDIEQFIAQCRQVPSVRAVFEG